MRELKTARRLPDDLTSKQITSRLQELIPHVGVADLETMTERVRRLRVSRLTNAQRVYMALQEIGRPAHYSMIAGVHNRMFPAHELAERNVLATLDRAGDGVVWVGVRGTYALEEWGYERPSAPLFDEVAEVVERIYDAGHRPVPLATIASEMGKYRKVVRPSSLSMAIYLNPRLREMDGGFVPCQPNEGADDIDLDRLDSILRDFEASSTQGPERSHAD